MSAGNGGWGPPGGPPPPDAGPGLPTYGQYVPYGWSMTHPGVVPLRPLTVSEILDGAITTMRRYPRPVFGLAAIVVVLQQLLAVIVILSTGGYGGTGNTTITGSTATSGLGAALGVRLISDVITVFFTGMVTVVVAEAVLGRSITAGGVWRRVRPMFGRLVGAAVLVVILPYLGLVALIVGGIFLWGALTLTTPALVLEGATVGTALRRSWRLAVPDWWRVFGIRLLAGIIAGVISTILQIPFAVGTLATNHHNLSGGAIAGLTVVGAVASILTTPFVSAVIALLYVDRRMRAEGLDIALQQAAGIAPPPAPTPGPPPGTAEPPPPTRW